MAVIFNDYEKPLAIDMSLCTNNLCKSKCARYQDYWQPSLYNQSYINPAMKYIKKGETFIPQKCEARLEI